MRQGNTRNSQAATLQGRFCFTEQKQQEKDMYNLLQEILPRSHFHSKSVMTQAKCELFDIVCMTLFQRQVTAELSSKTVNASNHS